MDFQSVFRARLVDHTGDGTLTDGSILWEVVTGDGEQIASCTAQGAAEALERALNSAVNEWAEEDPADRVVDAYPS